MATPDPNVFEKLASFYLGRHYDLDKSELLDELLMYDAKDLCTHAMCVGMTGSGKTGLCLSLLEEAAIDGIPAICVDPKGDLANLLLAFPDMEPEDFKPWLEEDEARRKGMSLDDLASKTATTWKDGLASWGQTPERVRKFKESVDVAVYTPGSNVGLPLTVLKSFDAPPPEARNDAELIGDKVTGSVSGLLTLMGIDADPMTSTEHILLSSIMSHEWREGRNVGIGQLIRLIQEPPISRIGVVDVDSFMSASNRGKLAMKLNNLLASPAFASWLEGEALSIKRLLHTADGKPRLSILSIAHLNDSERMFFVTILLNELLAWMRTQNGTSSLRAMFYMDEVAGYFPPVSKPPSKPPMLTLLKQARAFGLGITLATQNPVDLDYKGLSNIGTWFLGRLQTERDKARVLEGLEGAAGQTGQAFDRDKMEKTLAGLGNRVFLMNNVHDGFTTTFQTRWAMSFLAGPLARGQISRLMAPRKAAADDNLSKRNESVAQEVETNVRPVAPSGVEERFLSTTVRSREGAKQVYRPALFGEASMRFVKSSADLDSWLDAQRLMRCGVEFPDDMWDSSEPLGEDYELLDEPEEEFVFSDLPDELRSKGKYRTYRARFKDYLYRHCYLTIYKSPLLGEYAPGGCTKGEAKVFFKQELREQRDEATEKLRDKYESKMRTLESKIRTAQDRVARETAQYQQAKQSSWISVGSTIMGAFLGGRRSSIGTAARGFGRASQQKGDIDRAEESLEVLQDQMAELERELRDELDDVTRQYDADNLELEAIEIPPRKSDLKAEDVLIVWTPWQVDASGIATPLFELGES
ncbi:MAG: ATP-binding protein [Pirellulaceae bacterium]